MPVSISQHAPGRPWEDRVARLIPDPVRRLRFLRAAAPLPQTWPENEKRRPQTWLRRLRPFGGLPLVVSAAAFVLALALATVSVSRLRASAPSRTALRATPQPAPAPAVATGAPAEVWLVEKSGDAETYSNGLRIDNRFQAATHPRGYLAFPVPPGPARERTEPAGIVFHTTESRQAPFAAAENAALKRLGESLLEYVRRQQAYNFVIDRFGRVYRVVPEEQAANHSGYSVWADESWFYVNLNESFLGIAFEAVSSPEPPQDRISPAQARSAAMLIEMLRSRYGISAANCVTHAQVSVNPENMRVGLHADWASGFPFAELGLPDNYAEPLPPLWAYGFDCAGCFPGSARLEVGIGRASAILEGRAAAAGLRTAEYKERLRQRYRELLVQVQRWRRDGDPMRKGRPEMRPTHEPE